MTKPTLTKAERTLLQGLAVALALESEPGAKTVRLRMTRDEALEAARLLATKVVPMNQHEARRAALSQHLNWTRRLTGDGLNLRDAAELAVRMPAVDGLSWELGTEDKIERAGRQNARRPEYVAREASRKKRAPK